MTALTSQSPRFGHPPEGLLRRFSVAEYHQMVEAEILTENDSVELLEGWIVPKMPRNPRHDAMLQRFDEQIATRLPLGWRLRIQSAITLSDSEPEPDIAVVHGDSSKFLDHHPGPEEIAVVVEVSESTLTYDRNEKSRVYARAGLPEYWIVNLVDSQIEVHTSPTGASGMPEYLQAKVYSRGEMIPMHIGATVVSIAFDDLFAK